MKRAHGDTAHLLDKETNTCAKSLCARHQMLFSKGSDPRPMKCNYPNSNCCLTCQRVARSERQGTQFKVRHETHLRVSGEDLAARFVWGSYWPDCVTETGVGWIELTPLVCTPTCWWQTMGASQSTLVDWLVYSGQVNVYCNTFNMKQHSNRLSQIDRQQFKIIIVNVYTKIYGNQQQSFLGLW